MAGKLITSPRHEILVRQQGLCYHCKDSIVGQREVVSNGGAGATKYYHVDCARKLCIY